MFIYKEDEAFFIYLLGNELKLELFDSGVNAKSALDPILVRLDVDRKRKEFNRIKKRQLSEFKAKGRNNCELAFKGCTNKDFVLDHMIPLSSNELNKHLRPPQKSNSGGRAGRVRLWAARQEKESTYTELGFKSPL